MADRSAEVLRSNGYRVYLKKKNESGIYILHARKGAFGRIGPLLIHLSMVLIIVGAAFSYLLSFDHFQWMAPGDVIAIPRLRYMASVSYQIESLKEKLVTAFGFKHESSPILKMDMTVRSSDWRDLPNELREESAFQVRLDKFEARFTTDGKPKAYLSTVTVLDSEDKAGELYSYLIKVNDPLIHEGVYFYQSSFSTGMGEAEWVELTVTDKDSLTQEKGYKIRLKPGDMPLPLGETGDSCSIGQFTGNFKLGSNGLAQTRPGDDSNPAVKVIIRNGSGIKYDSWVFKQFPNFSHGSKGRYSVTMDSFGRSYLTGLTIRTHRSQVIIWFGFILMVAGVILSFYVNYRRFWVLVEPIESGARAFIAGSSYKWKQPFKTEFSETVERIKQQSGR